MLGTTFRLGFDSTAVNRGLRGVGSLMGRFTRQVGIGGARQIGARASDLIGRVLGAIPNATRDLADWAGGMTDVSAQTRVATRDLILMEEAMRLSGVGMDSSRMISVLAKNLHDAATEGGAAKDALNSLGISAQAFVGVPIDKAFLQIGKRVAELGPDFEGIESVMGDLFGARSGFKLLRFFNTFDESMALARKNTAAWGDVAEDTFTDLDKMSDAAGRWSMARRQIMLSFLKGWGAGPMLPPGVGGVGDGLNLLFDQLAQSGPAIETFGRRLRNTGRWLAEEVAGGLKGLGGMLKNLGSLIAQGALDGLKAMGAELKVLGRWLGEGVSEGLKIPGVGGAIKGLFSSNATAPGGESFGHKHLAKLDAIVTELRNQPNVAIFA